MDPDDFFLVEDMTRVPPAEPATPAGDTAEQGQLFDVCTYRGPRNRRGVTNTAALDPFGNPTI